MDYQKPRLLRENTNVCVTLAVQQVLVEVPASHPPYYSLGGRGQWDLPLFIPTWPDLCENRVPLLFGAFPKGMYIGWAGKSINKSGS